MSAPMPGGGRNNMVRTASLIRKSLQKGANLAGGNTAALKIPICPGGLARSSDRRNAGDRRHRQSWYVFGKRRSLRFGGEAFAGFGAKTVVGATVAGLLVSEKMFEVRALKLAIRAMRKPHQMPQTFENVVGTALVMKGGKRAFIGRSRQKAAQKAPLPRKMRLMLHHRESRLHVLRHQREETQELEFLLERTGGLAGQKGVMLGRTKKMQDFFHMTDAGVDVQLLDRHVQQFNGALEMRIPPGQVDGPVQIEFVFRRRNAHGGVIAKSPMRFNAIERFTVRASQTRRRRCVR